MDRGWTIDRLRWTLLRNTMGDKSHWRISRLRDTGDTMIPKKPGVYMLCVRPLLCEETFVVDVHSNDAKGLYNALYIGESDNLRRRYRYYVKTEKKPEGQPERLAEFLACFAGRIDFCYWVMDKAQKPRLQDVQNVLIACFGPSANTQGGGNVLIGIGLKPVAA